MSHKATCYLWKSYCESFRTKESYRVMQSIKPNMKQGRLYRGNNTALYSSGPTAVTGANRATGTGCGDECGPSGPSRAAAVRVGPAVVLGTPPYHLEVRGRRGDLPWLPIKAGVSVHPQEYLRRFKALLDCHFLPVYALFQSIEVLPSLALLAHLFLQSDAPMEHFHPLMGDAPQPVHLSLHAEVP